MHILIWGSCCRDHMVAGFPSTYAISAITTNVARVMSAFKKDDKSGPSDYRPIYYHY